MSNQEIVQSKGYMFNGKNLPNPIVLMPEVTSGPFQNIESVPWQIDMRDGDGGKIYPDSKHAFYQSSDKYAGGAQYALTGVAITALANAAGIKPIETENHLVPSYIQHPFVVSWRWGGEWGNGAISQALDYTLDLRDYITVDGEKIMAPRFEEAYNKYRQQQLKQYTLDHKMMIPKDMSTADSINFFERIFDKADADEQAAIARVAVRMAQREIVGARIHMYRKAQSGAMMATFRKMLNLKQAYSMGDLMRGFVVYRMRDDMERFKLLLGDDNMKAAGLMALGNALGIRLDSSQMALALSAVRGELSAPAPTQQAIAAPLDEENPDVAVITEQAEEEVKEEPKVEAKKEPTPAPVSAPAPVVTPEPVPTMTGKKQLPWREGVKDAPLDWLPTDKVSPVFDVKLMDKAKQLITPLNHLSNHLSKHYQCKRWGEMTLDKAEKFWAELVKMEFPDGEL